MKSEGVNLISPPNIYFEIISEKVEEYDNSQVNVNILLKKSSIMVSKKLGGILGSNHVLGVPQKS